jgi:hypothetical protein
MEFVERAKIRIAHWVEHNEDHVKEYENFARELESAGKIECAGHVREMAALAARSGECLRRARAALQ